MPKTMTTTPGFRILGNFHVNGEVFLQLLETLFVG